MHKCSVWFHLCVVHCSFSHHVSDALENGILLFSNFSCKKLCDKKLSRDHTHIWVLETNPPSPAMLIFVTAHVTYSGSNENALIRCSMNYDAL